ncbi:DUF4097 family beta strand repeat-containing protein [Lentibacillus saliphilus]|uniref:DUF4097 family beta strand repeat-containing protein n=1 Tax=Lentibacillus saliphilus TaxID=2737028 RepID=UPI001C30544B|nr:DUF4097 family beta strand repeat-containing protein [Lentibacillus saliphilus]
MRSVKWFVVVALIFIVIGGIGSLMTFQSVMADEDATENEQVNVENVTTIDVASVNEQVIVKKIADNAQATVEWTGKVRKGREDRLTVEVSEDTLSVKMKRERFKLFNFDFNFFNNNELIISLPEKAYESLEVKNNNGDISIDHFIVKDVHVDTDNGRIELANLTTNRVHAETDNGKIYMEDVLGEVTGRSRNGSVTLVTADLDRQINLKTNNGRIVVETAQQPTNAMIDAHTDNGRIDIFGEDGRSKLYGDGDNQVKLTTNNGSITVEER